MQGQVVRAVRGNRQAYRPVVSRLVEGSDPVTVACALLDHCASRRLYAADLDALTGRPAQAAVLRALLQARPDLEFWVDAGFRRAADADDLCERVGSGAERIVPVFGSESIASADDLAAISQRDADAVLSLDRRDGHRLDAAGCWDRPALWPARVIVMTLERVGADSGPDLDTLAEVQARAPKAQLVGAGGVRDGADLDRAATAGAWAWLVASALHDGRLPPAAR